MVEDVEVHAGHLIGIFFFNSLDVGLDVVLPEPAAGEDMRRHVYAWRADSCVLRRREGQAGHGGLSQL